MATVHEVELWVLVDENGDYVVHKDADELADTYDGEIGGDAAVSRRAVKVVLRVPVESHVTLSADVPHDGEALLKVEA